ncbi:hypothetical protein ABMA28_010271 [Loxostege sticticalis]|uniref:Uncharacterized protein n=1 Tax=Loxostege sticticalis TaxID=481309 RepID=A0ABD0SA91_LOXSC
MVTLTGNSLPKRQQELNNQVIEAASKNIPFEVIKAGKETTDVDRLFKIDLAAKYRNTDYILETLKSGDPLYISRVLKKCHWLYDDEFSNIINTDFLHHNVFPLMSIKMKKKLLAALTMNITNENRAADFYHYCKKTKLDNLAEKFLIFTSESFKLDLIQRSIHDIPQRDKYFKSLFGASFTLFEAYLQQDAWTNNVLHECSYLYSVSDVKYLDMLEKHLKIKSGQDFTLGLRISKDIVVKHKKRILEKPDLYLSILNLGKLLRHSSRNEVEFFAIFLLPNNLSEFWRKSNQTKFKQIINVAQDDEKYAFAKKIFADKYHNEEFEMFKQFYDEKYYNLMTSVEREAWALKHLASGQEILGSGKDYVWYQFLKFDKAFEEIKKCILTATDKNKRADLLEVLVRSAKSNEELEKVFGYYYQRHANERKQNKNDFLHTVLNHHNVFKFDDKCWEAFNKILGSLKVYDASGDAEFKIVAIIYHILNDKAMPDALIQYMESAMAMYSVKIYIENVDAESKTKVYDYIFKFYMDRILKFEPGTKDDKLVLNMHFLLELMALFEKTKADIPNIILEFVNCDRDSYKYQQILQGSVLPTLTENDLLKLLKKDSKLVIEKLPEVKRVIDDSWNFKMKHLLNKVKVYFSNDIAKEFIILFNELLTQISYSKTANAAVYGIFQLSEEDYKISFLNKYAPQSAKIEHDTIDRTLLYTQEAICRLACYSRPPVPLSNMLMYLKGDYVHFCLPMFNRYLTNLPMPLCLKFVESLIDAPVSIQKHGLRLAFQCFSAENLKKLVLDAWKNTKNVSIRSVIYKALFEKTANEPDNELCEALKALTLDLHDTDDDELFGLLKYDVKKLPADFIGDFVEALWAAVSVFKDNEQNITRKTFVIKLMDDKMFLMKKETLKGIVSEHVKSMFGNEDKNIQYDEKCKDLHLSKWELDAHYIEYYTSNESDLSESIEMAKFIVRRCLEQWNDVACDIYVFRKLYLEFIENLDQIRFVPIAGTCGALLPDTKSFENAIPIFEAILADLQTTLPLHEIYIHVWNLRVIITNRRVIKESRLGYPTDVGVKAIEETGVKFGKEVGNMVKQAAENNTYFAYFSEDIKDLICNGARNIELHLRHGREISIKQEDIELSIARGLLELNTKETSILALQILPLNKKCNLDLYKSVYNVLKENPDTEIQCCLFKKFSSDCKRRRLE